MKYMVQRVIRLPVTDGIPYNSQPLHVEVLCECSYRGILPYIYIHTSYRHSID